MFSLYAHTNSQQGSYWQQGRENNAHEHEEPQSTSSSNSEKETKEEKTQPSVNSSTESKEEQEGEQSSTSKPVQMCVGNSFAQPQKLAEVKAVEVMYVRSRYQAGESCAWYSVMAARAIQDIVLKKEPLSVQKIAQRVHDTILPLAKRNNHYIMARIGSVDARCNLTHGQMERLACVIGLSNYYSLSLSHNSEHPTYYEKQPMCALCTNSSGALSCDHYYPFSADLVLKRILQSRAPVKHIFFSDPFSDHVNQDHGVLISLVTRQHKKPLLILLDACHDCFESCCTTYKIPDYFDLYIDMIDQAVAEWST